MGSACVMHMGFHTKSDMPCIAFWSLSAGIAEKYFMFMSVEVIANSSEIRTAPLGTSNKAGKQSSQAFRSAIDNQKWGPSTKNPDYQSRSPSPPENVNRELRNSHNESRRKIDAKCDKNFIKILHGQTFSYYPTGIMDGCGNFFSHHEDVAAYKLSSSFVTHVIIEDRFNQLQV